jgi:hypothetical protein
VEANADLSYVVRGVRCRTEAYDRVHLADYAVRPPCGSESDLAVPRACLELVEHEESVAVDINVNAQATFSIRPDRHWNVPDERAQDRRPLDGVVTERHELLNSSIIGGLGPDGCDAPIE